MRPVAVVLVHVPMHMSIDCNLGLVLSMSGRMHMVVRSFDCMGMVMSRPMGVRDRFVMRMSSLVRVAAQEEVKAQTCNGHPGNHTEPRVELFRYDVARSI